jgi:amino acid adenylation domain-containing protein
MNQPFNGLNIVRDCSTIVDVLRWRSLTQPEQIAFTFLADGETTQATLTYQQLDQRSRAIASQLQSLGISQQRALLLYPPGLDYLAAFFGCLYAGVVAVPAYPPRNQRNTPRILAILADAEAAIILTTTSILSQVQSLFAGEIDLDHVKWLTTDNVTPGSETTWQEPVINAETLAFLQYTSGSTGTPKGVMLSHGNLLHNASVTYEYMEHDPSSKFVTWLPVYHDMGLIGGVLQPLYGGFPCVMMSPTAFLQCPYRWLQAISQHGGTTSGAPNFAYELCIEKITPEQRSTLDLSSWNVAFNGAEPIRYETLEKFAATFAECGFRPEAFYPCYGMAEATLMVSGSVKSALVSSKTLQKSGLERNYIIDTVPQSEDSISIVGCGRVVPQQQIVIANPDTLTRCHPHEVGEIWVCGPSIGHGYWNRPQETEQTFGAYLQDTGEGPFLRTGDLGFLDNGELFITGRAKDVIIIRGRNLYPQDIELTSERSHEMLRAGSVAAFSVDVDTTEQLVIVQELEFRAKPNIQEVTAAIRQAIAEAHEIQVYAVILLKAGTIPKTSSGKIQRRATKAGFLAGTLDIVGSSILEISQPTAAEDFLTRTELLAVEPAQQQELLNTYLQKLVARVLRVAPCQVGLEQPLTSFGLDSLKVFELKNRIEIDFGVAISVADFFDGINIAELVPQILQQIAENPTNLYLPISPVARVTHQHPLSYTQQQLWFINQLQPGKATYNIAVAIDIPEKLNFTALVSSFHEIIHRHEILRTSFVVVDGEPRQKIVDVVNFTIPEIDLRHLTAEQQRIELPKLSLAESQVAFDLETAPLLRAKLLHLQAEKSRLVLTLHHLVADGWSIQLLVTKLSEIYQTLCTEKPLELPDLPIQYLDFVYWQRNWLETEIINQHLDYWQEKLTGNLPVLQLPTDFPRPAIQTFQGAQQKFILSRKLTKAIKKLSQQEGATLFMTLLAAFKTLLYRYTGQTDILIGSPIANRNRPEIDSLIGCFVNTLVLRTNLAGNPTFKELLGRVRQVAIAAYTHQDLPFEKLVEVLQPHRDLSYNPLFQSMFVLQTPASDRIWKTEEIDTGTAKFDIFLSMMESGDSLTGTIEYNTDLFTADTITRIVGHFQTLLEAIVSNSQQPISELPLLTSAERQTLLVDWNHTQVDYPQAACIHHLFEVQVQKTPDAVAVVFGDEQLTYQELNQQANQLANYLQKLGVQPDVLVGVCVQRSLAMIVAILAILKAGGAYVPIDPNYPQERLQFMLTNSQAPVLLTQQQLVEKIGNCNAQVICLDDDRTLISQEKIANPSSLTNGHNLAYVIYTSGSTGQPKGVAIEHHSPVALIHWAKTLYSPADLAGVLASTSICFDLSVFEIFVPLSYGGTVILVENALSLAELNTAQPVTLINTVPSAIASLLSQQAIPSSVKTINLAGEPLSNQLVQEIYQLEHIQRVFNLYGPSEDTTYSTYALIPRHHQQTITIGRPISNTQVYLLDQYLQPVPIGVAGELYIGGVGLARGYWQRPELTQEKFISHPFEPETRLYKTGDLARYLPDGSLEFLGRIDHQIKLRGFRIELGEIEAALLQNPNVQQTVVVAQESRLIAYVVLADQTATSVNDFRLFLQKKLPEYMLPSTFVLLEALPLTPNGKIDRQALPAPDNLRPELTATYQAPQSQVEKTIAQIWQQVLKLEKVGIHDNFFDIGGNSLLLVQVNNKLREILQIDLSVVETFQNPTVKLLAQHLDKKQESFSEFKAIRERTHKRLEFIHQQQKRRSQL